MSLQSYSWFYIIHIVLQLTFELINLYYFLKIAYNNVVCSCRQSIYCRWLICLLFWHYYFTYLKRFWCFMILNGYLRFTKVFVFWEQMWFFSVIFILEKLLYDNGNNDEHFFKSYFNTLQNHLHFTTTKILKKLYSKIFLRLKSYHTMDESMVFT